MLLHEGHVRYESYREVPKIFISQRRQPMHEAQTQSRQRGIGFLFLAPGLRSGMRGRGSHWK